jgi:hypothetical protein
MLGTKQKIKWQRTDEGPILKMPAYIIQPQNKIRQLIILPTTPEAV